MLEVGHRPAHPLCEAAMTQIFYRSETNQALLGGPTSKHGKSSFIFVRTSTLGRGTIRLLISPQTARDIGAYFVKDMELDAIGCFSGNRSLILVTEK